jgi:hypothetical protein
MGLHLRNESVQSSILSYSKAHSDAARHLLECEQQFDQSVQQLVTPEQFKTVNGKQVCYLPREELLRLAEPVLAARADLNRRSVELASIAQQIQNKIDGEAAEDKPPRSRPPGGPARQDWQLRTDDEIMRLMMIGARTLAAKGKPLTVKIIKRYCRFPRYQKLIKRLVTEGKLCYKPFKFRRGPGGKGRATKLALTLGPNGSK